MTLVQSCLYWVDNNATFFGHNLSTSNIFVTPPAKGITLPLYSPKILKIKLPTEKIFKFFYINIRLPKMEAMLSGLNMNHFLYITIQ